MSSLPQALREKPFAALGRADLGKKSLIWERRPQIRPQGFWASSWQFPSCCHQEAHPSWHFCPGRRQPKPSCLLPSPNGDPSKGHLKTPGQWHSGMRIKHLPKQLGQRMRGTWLTASLLWEGRKARFPQHEASCWEHPSKTSLKQRCPAEQWPTPCRDPWLPRGAPPPLHLLPILPSPTPGMPCSLWLELSAAGACWDSKDAEFHLPVWMRRRRHEGAVKPSLAGARIRRTPTQLEPFTL